MRERHALGPCAPELRCNAAALCCLLAMLTLTGSEATARAADGKIVASCDFEGPYRSGKQEIHDGWLNNWSWGTKDMVFEAERDAGRPGTVQSIHVRGISSGAVQFFYTKVRLKKGRYYRVSFWIKGDGLEGPVSAIIRKIGGPWTAYVRGWRGVPGTTWEHCTFAGQSSADVPEDVGVMFQTGSLGKLWLDALVVEELEERVDGQTQGPADIAAGNLLPRCSYEGMRDVLWSSGVYATGGRVEGEWEDPQAHRVRGGRFGQHCMAIPTPSFGGTVFCRSTWVDVVPGRHYTFSAWLRADKPGTNVYLAIQRSDGRGGIGGKGCRLSTEWQRCSATGQVKHGTVRKVFLGISSRTPKATIFADGFLFETAQQPTEFRPRHPLELYADSGPESRNLFEWGSTVPLRVLAAAADSAAIDRVRVKLTVTGYPDLTVHTEAREIPVGEPCLFELAPKRRGLFRAVVETEDGQLAAPQEMLFAVLPKPRPTGPESLFGTHITVRPFFIDYARRIGIKWIRVHDATLITKWCCGEPERGEYRWYDTQVDAIRDAGLHILGMPGRAPKWAELEPDKATNVVDVPAFRTYCRKVAEHYRGRIDHWEVWNEPYMRRHFFKGTAQQFGEVFAAGARGLREGNPDAKVLGYCSALNGLKYAKSIVPDSRSLIDIVSFHCYQTGLTGGGTLPCAGELRDYHEFFGGPDRISYWNTEGNNGYLAASGFYSFLAADPQILEWACAYASRVWIEHAKAGVSKFFLYTTHQTDTIMYYGGYKLLLGFDRSPTPAATATAVTAWCIDGLTCLPCPATPGIAQALFSGDRRSTWVVYDDAGVPGRRTLSLESLPRSVRLLDVMGNDPRKDGTVSWEIGVTPLFAVSEDLGPDRLRQVMQAAVSK